jgi:hypothetical protein
MDQYQYEDGTKTSVKVKHQPGKNSLPLKNYLKIIAFLGGASSWSMGWGADEPPAPTRGGRAAVPNNQNN